MAHWLLKTEPSTYSFDDLLAEGTTAWTGVKNPQARLHLKAMAVGDALVVYHSGEKAAVGLAVVSKPARPDPEAGEGGVQVEVKAGARLAAPVPLEALKGSTAFAKSPLLTQGRLSVVPLTAPQWKALLALSKHVKKKG